jgi:iron-sulfur cluster assembly protein
MNNLKNTVQVDFKSFPAVLSEKSIEVIEKTLSNKSRANKILRISVKGGGCSGFKYRLNFVKNFSDNDIYCYHRKSICLVVDINSYCCLQNTVIDFVSTNKGAGFVFTNPSNLQSCNGCD